MKSSSSSLLRKEPFIAGLLVGIFSGVLMVEYANNFGALTSSVFNIPFMGSLYIAVIALAFNLAISFGGSIIMNTKMISFARRKTEKREEEYSER